MKSHAPPEPGTVGAARVKLSHAGGQFDLTYVYFQMCATVNLLPIRRWFRPDILRTGGSDRFCERGIDP
ncbi:MAG: hypothetical protein OXQ89_03950 [Rhodospirillaceae bacterium]|nr:hypothetical protein [Rhodospirillaceae bacterium]MDE0362660.1 hypothetical protein [Rhodospirillaceae bacterium]